MGSRSSSPLSLYLGKGVALFREIDKTPCLFRCQVGSLFRCRFEFGGSGNQGRPKAQLLLTRTGLAHCPSALLYVPPQFEIEESIYAGIEPHSQPNFYPFVRQAFFDVQSAMVAGPVGK